MRRNWPLSGFAFALSIILVIRKRFLVVKVYGSSMAPCYQDGDTLLAVRLSGSHSWRAGEDLVFTRANQPVLAPGDPAYLIKRICAVPGDPVPELLEDRIADLVDRGSTPPGLLLLQGMTSPGVKPSFYPVPVEAVVGKVVCRLHRS